MTRIEKTFATLRARNEKALIIYLTAGDPSLDITKKLILPWRKVAQTFWKSAFLFPTRQRTDR